jgi:FMN phosphatase YigB (HAD superfamily)
LIIKKDDIFILNQDLFEYLNSRPERKIVVTNAKDEILKEIKKLLKNSDFEVFSLEFNPEKTNPQYFEILLQSLGLEAKDCLYLDHSLDNLNSAKQVEIPGILYQNNDFSEFKKVLEIAK